MKDVKNIFDWAKKYGEVKAVDRILVKVMIQLMRSKIILTSKQLDNMEESLELPEALYDSIKIAAEAVVGKVFDESCEEN